MFKDVSLKYKHLKQPCSRASSAVVACACVSMCVCVCAHAHAPRRFISDFLFLNSDLRRHRRVQQARQRRLHRQLAVSQLYGMTPFQKPLSSSLRGFCCLAEGSRPSAGLLPLRQLQDGLHWRSGEGVQAGDQLRKQPDQPL